MRIALSVRQRKLSPEPVCDFCGQEEPIWVYGSSRTSAGEIRDCWRWAACYSCSYLIDSDDWEPIRQKLLKWLERRGPAPRLVLLQAIDMSLDEFHFFVLRD